MVLAWGAPARVYATNTQQSIQSGGAAKLKPLSDGRAVVFYNYNGTVYARVVAKPTDMALAPVVGAEHLVYDGSSTSNSQMQVARIAAGAVDVFLVVVPTTVFVSPYDRPYLDLMVVSVAAGSAVVTKVSQQRVDGHTVYSYATGSAATLNAVQLDGDALDRGVTLVRASNTATGGLQAHRVTWDGSAAAYSAPTPIEAKIQFAANEIRVRTLRGIHVSDYRTLVWFRGYARHTRSSGSAEYAPVGSIATGDAIGGTDDYLLMLDHASLAAPRVSLAGTDGYYQHFLTPNNVSAPSVDRGGVHLQMTTAANARRFSKLLLATDPVTVTEFIQLPASTLSAEQYLRVGGAIARYASASSGTALSTAMQVIQGADVVSPAFNYVNNGNINTTAARGPVGFAPGDPGCFWTMITASDTKASNQRYTPWVAYVSGFPVVEAPPEPVLGGWNLGIAWG